LDGEEGTDFGEVATLNWLKRAQSWDSVSKSEAMSFVPAARHSACSGADELAIQPHLINAQKRGAGVRGLNRSASPRPPQPGGWLTLATGE
jgi:hypothetical protein